MKNDIQVQLADWIERLRNDPSTAWVFNDWLQENNLPNQQIAEAMKFLLMAHGAIVVPSLLKWCGITTYFTKFKIVVIQQKGFSYKIKISKRPKFWTNMRLTNHRCYKKLR